jgi:hypothetical protein
VRILIYIKEFTLFSLNIYTVKNSRFWHLCQRLQDILFPDYRKTPREAAWFLFTYAAAGQVFLWHLRDTYPVITRLI